MYAHDLGERHQSVSKVGSEPSKDRPSARAIRLTP